MQQAEDALNLTNRSKANQEKMNQSTNHTPASGATIHAVALSPQSTIPILDASETAGYGFRQYPTVDSLLEAAAPSSTGCVLVECDDDVMRTTNTIDRIQGHFFSMPMIALLGSNSAAKAVGLMQQGVFSVLPQPFEHQKLVQTLTSAVEASIRNQTTVDSCRDASLRMREATEKEIEVLHLIMEGKKNKEIAALLRITVRAVEDRRFRLMKKVGVDSVAELVALAVSGRYYDQGFVSSGLRSAFVPDTNHGVKGIEVWIPSDDETQLVQSQCCYRDAVAFREASQGITFRRGEGLPGRVWEMRAPAFLKELITNDFVRSSAAGAVGMTTAVGFPIFCQERVQAIVLILLDSRHQMKAAFESWRLEPDKSALRLSGGTFVNCEKLRKLSGYISLPVGEGLPGFVAEQARPYVGSRFAEDGNSVRGIALAAEQLISGVALPLTDSGSAISDVFLMFNSETTPMFSLLQIWKPDNEQTGVRLVSEYVDGIPSLASQMSTLSQHSIEGSIAGRCCKSAAPIVVDNGDASQILRSTSGPSPAFGVAIPTMINGKVVAVTVLAN